MTVPPPTAPSPRPVELDDAIPLLTEIVEIPAEAPAVAPPARTELLAAATEADWAGLEQRLHDQVLARIAAHAQDLFGQALEARVDSLLAQAAAQLSQDLRQTFAELVQNTVTRAVDEALATARAAADDPPSSI